MILHRIAVTNWRSLLGTLDIGPLNERFNVIHAPNGTGKSSLFEALRLALFDSHKVTGKDIEAVKPWGRELTPSVLVEFTEGGETWRIEKTFVSSPSARLSRLENGAFCPVADSRDADEKVRAIIAAEAPGRGLSKSEHWGIAQVLWAPQGQLQLSDLSQTAAGCLKQALGVQVAHEGSGDLERRIDARFREFFTEKGKAKKTQNATPDKRLRDELEALHRRQMLARQELEAFEHASRDVEDARQERLQRRREADQLRETVAQVRSQAENYKRLLEDQNRCSEAVELAAQRYESLDSRIRKIAEIRKTIATLELREKDQLKRLTTLETDLANAADTREARRIAREKARARRAEIDREQQIIDDARAFAEATRQIDALGKRLERVRAFDSELETLLKRRSEIVAPDATILKDLRKAIKERDKAQIRLDAAQLRLTLTPLEATRVTESATDLETLIPAGMPHTFSGDDSIDLSVPGFGSLRASGPEGTDAAKHRASLHEQRSRIRSIAQPFGSDDPDVLDQLLQQATRIDQSIKELQGQRQTVLDGADPNALRQHLAELEASRTTLLKQHQQWTTEPPTLSQLQTNFDSLRRRIEEAIADAEKASDQAQNAFASIEEQRTATAGERKLTASQLESASNDLKSLTEQQPSDASSERSRDEAALEVQSRRARLKKISEELDGFAADPASELATLEKQKTALESAETQARDKEKTAEGRLQSLAGKGTYSRLTEVEESIAVKEAELERITLVMDAVKLLRQKITECRQRQLDAIAAPVEQAATRLLERVAGPGLGSLQFSESFAPRSIKPPRQPNNIGIDNLSGGEQEQLQLVARLALADVLAKDCRQPVVLDDVLNATDSRRLARMLNLLTEASTRLQLIIITCHPERYHALDDALFIDLAENSIRA